MWIQFLSHSAATVIMQTRLGGTGNLKTDVCDSIVLV